MLVLRFLGAPLHKSLQIFILGAESGFKFLLPRRDVLLPGIQKRLALRHASLPGNDILPRHRDCLLLPQEDLELLVVPVMQFGAFFLQLLVHFVGGLALLLELVPLPVVPLPHLFELSCHGNNEG